MQAGSRPSAERSTVELADLIGNRRDEVVPEFRMEVFDQPHGRRRRRSIIVELGAVESDRSVVLACAGRNQDLPINEEGCGVPEEARCVKAV